ncbi:MAG: AraC family transcriptional regulator [Cellvibrionaceae bacterium]|nr:AraC family transcriptional regulator [Cellvibrionaceae bacterium]
MFFNFLSYDKYIEKLPCYNKFSINEKLLRKIYILEHDTIFSKYFSCVDCLLKGHEILNLLLSLDVSDAIIYSFLNSEDLKIIKLKRFMANNYLKKWGICDFSKKLGYSTSTFNSLFFKIYGQRPKKWIKLKRLDDAKSILFNKSKSISDIAQELNFSDSSHFINSFKEVYKITPSEYRKSL